MPQQVMRTHKSGLVLAEDAMDEAAVGRAVKRIDPGFVLQKERRDGAPGGWLYRIVHIRTGTPVLMWTDERLRPLPLSSGILDMFQRHLVGARNAGPDADEHNAALVRAAAKRNRDESAALADWYRPHLERGRLTVSPKAGLAKKPYWARKPKRAS